MIVGLVILVMVGRVLSYSHTPGSADLILFVRMLWAAEFNIGVMFLVQ